MKKNVIMGMLLVMTTILLAGCEGDSETKEPSMQNPIGENHAEDFFEGDGEYQGIFKEELDKYGISLNKVSDKYISDMSRQIYKSQTGGQVYEVLEDTVFTYGDIVLDLSDKKTFDSLLSTELQRIENTGSENIIAYAMGSERPLLSINSDCYILETLDSDGTLRIVDVNFRNTEGAKKFKLNYKGITVSSRVSDVLETLGTPTYLDVTVKKEKSQQTDNLPYSKLYMSYTYRTGITVYLEFYQDSYLDNSYYISKLRVYL